MRYLLAEQDPDVRTLTAQLLKHEGFAVDETDQGITALRWAKSQTYDGMILDWRLHDVDGLTVLTEIRQCGLTFPIMVLTSLNDGDEASRALLAGADDFVRKPFSYREVVARLRVLQRRRALQPTHELSLDTLVMDVDRHMVTRQGHPIFLSNKEFALLEYFLRHQDRVLSKSELLEHVWDQYADPFTHTVDVHVRNLRMKIDTPFKYPLLKTVYGRGFCLTRRIIKTRNES